MPPRIDTHQHIVPPDYRRWLEGQGVDAGGAPLPLWSAEAALEAMDDMDISTGVLSVSTPGVHLTGDSSAPAPVAREWARRVNEFSAETVKDKPGRFGFFATLTLPDVDGALDEAAYALDVLQADGIVLPTNVYGRYVGDQAFDPLFEELGRRGAVVFIHPSELPVEPIEGIPPFAVDFLLDTVRAALNISRSGTLEKFPDLKVILGHAGGFVPFAAQRMAPFAGKGDVARGLAILKRFYFDVALSSSPFALPALLAFADPTHLTFGSDFPFPPSTVVKSMADALDDFELTEAQRTAINHRNAEKLFPRIAESMRQSVADRQL